MVGCDRSGNGRSNHYHVLEVHPNASRQEIRDAFLRLAKENHPDSSDRAEGTNYDTFARVTRAWEVLGNDDLRRQFDQQLSAPSSAPHDDSADSIRSREGSIFGARHYNAQTGYTDFRKAQQAWAQVHQQAQYQAVVDELIQRGDQSRWGRFSRVPLRTVVLCAFVVGAAAFHIFRDAHKISGLLRERYRLGWARKA